MPDYKKDAEEISKDLSRYFLSASLFKQINISRALPIIEKWGDLVVSTGFGWIVRDINSLSKVTVPASLSVEGQRLNEVVIGRAITNMAYMHDLLQACGENAQKWLIESLFQFHEDIRALAAYCLADDMWRLDTPKKILRAREAYALTEGSACKAAIALALFMGGDRRYLRDFLKKGWFGPEEMYNYFEAQARRQVSGSETIDNLEMGVVLLMVVPETLGAPPNNAGLIKMIALDIESNGRAARAISGWRRKQYPNLNS